MLEAMRYCFSLLPEANLICHIFWLRKTSEEKKVTDTKCIKPTMSCLGSIFPNHEMRQITLAVVTCLRWGPCIYIWSHTFNFFTLSACISMGNVGWVPSTSQKHKKEFVYTGNLFISNHLDYNYIIIYKSIQISHRSTVFEYHFC